MREDAILYIKMLQSRQSSVRQKNLSPESKISFGVDILFSIEHQTTFLELKMLPLDFFAFARNQMVLLKNTTVERVIYQFS